MGPTLRTSEVGSYPFTRTIGKLLTWPPRDHLPGAATNLMSKENKMKTILTDPKAKEAAREAGKAAWSEAKTEGKDSSECRQAYMKAYNAIYRNTPEVLAYHRRARKPKED